jgi:hypothetical protein
MAKMDPVAAARKVLEDAEAAVAAEGKRLERATVAADKHAAEAAEIDPDADPRGFEKATGKQAELRATVEIVRSRVAGSERKAAAAREALAAAENADRRARLEALNAEITERERKALEALRGSLAAFAAEVADLGAASSKAHTLAAELRAAGTDVRAVRAGTAAWAGAHPGRLAQLASESWRF